MNKKTAATVIITTLILAAIPLTVYLSGRPQKTVTVAAPETKLSISPATKTVVLNETFTLNIAINSGNNVVFGTDLEILFNPAILEAQSVSAGDFLNSPQEITKVIDNQAGKITYSLGAFSSKTGQGTLASISFKAKSGGSSEISFGSGTSVAAAGEDEALSSTQGGMVSVASAGSLSFKVKLQGIDQQRTNETVKVTLKKGGSTIATHETVSISADENGAYSGSVPNISFDTYDVLVKGWSHLTKKFANISLNQLENSFDWSGTKLTAGDATGDDKINIQDFRILVENYLKGSSIADFNLDGQTNIQDFRFIAENYLKTGEQ